MNFRLSNRNAADRNHVGYVVTGVDTFCLHLNFHSNIYKSMQWIYSTVPLVIELLNGN